ncbi:MAG TPA: SLC13 family permease, partial [bacterium]|nr:SLC13 family permease [bacterium]
TTWCKNNKVSPSRLLLPLSYLAVLGGTCTLIGTSTNLVVQGLMEEAVHVAEPGLRLALRPMGLFELSFVGVPCTLVGVLYLFFVGRHLIPTRKGFLEQIRGCSRDYLINVRVESGYRFISKTVEEAGLRHLHGLFLIEIDRKGEIISPVGPEQTLFEGDMLTFTGIISTIVDLEKIPGLVPIADDSYETRMDVRREKLLCESVVSRTSPMVGQSIREGNFRARYNAAVVAVHRGGERLKGRVGDIVLLPGDTLLLQAGPHFVAAHRNDPDFYLVSGVEDSSVVRHDKAAIALALLAVLIVLMATGVTSIVMAAFIVAGLMLATGCISVSQARQSLEWQTLLTICAAFGIAKGLENSGCVATVSQIITDIFSRGGPKAVLSGVFLMTMGFTSLVGNNSAAALMFPFGVAIALNMGVSPRPFVMMITLAASACFMTPVGYQTNMMVYGPGGYRFSDFLRVGAVLNCLLLLVSVLLVPIIWPL